MKPALVKHLLVAALICLALTACNDNLLSAGDKGFVSYAGDYQIVPAAEREAPTPIRGTTLTGDEIELEDFRGKIVVMPVWGSWCGPCRDEAPMFEQASKELAAEGVALLGINVRDFDEADRAAFLRNHGITYPSLDDPDGSLILNFNAGLSPKAIPSVAFIDAEGRVAAALSGEVTRTTLNDVIEEIRS